MNLARLAFATSALAGLLLAAAPAAAQHHYAHDRGARPVHDTRTIAPTTPDEYLRTDAYLDRVASAAAPIDDATADRYVASARQWVQDAADVIRTRGPVRDMRDALARAEADLRAAEARIDQVRGDVARTGRAATQVMEEIERTPRSLFTPWLERELIRTQDALFAGDRALASGSYGSAARYYDDALRGANRLITELEAERRQQERRAELDREYAAADARVTTILQRTHASTSRRTPVEATRQAQRALALQDAAAGRYARGDVEGALRDLNEAWLAADAAWTLAASVPDTTYGHRSATPAAWDGYDDRGDCDRGRWYDRSM